MKVLVTNKAERAVVFGSVVLSPGANLIEESLLKDWHKVLEDHDHIEIGNSKGADEKTLGELSLKEVVPMILEMNDEDVLKSWKFDEENGKQRAGVLKAIEKKLEEIEAHITRK